MNPRGALPPDLRKLANLQEGVLTREQALEFGVSRHTVQRLVAADDWRLLARGVYLTMPVEPPWLALAWAGVLLGGPEARLGGLAAGYLHRLVRQPPETVEVLVPSARVVANRPPWTFRRECAGARSVSTVGSPPRLAVVDTVLDLCAIGTEAQVVSYVTTAVQGRLSTPDRLLRGVQHRRRLRHRQLLLDLMADVAEGAESALELRYLRDVERPHGLPVGDRQASRFGLPYCSDVGYDDYQTLVELDGRDGHLGEGRFRDMRRDNRFALVTWLTLRYGWFDVVDHPCAVAWQVGTALRQRGWTGRLTHCVRCRHRSDAELLRLA